MLWLLLSWPPWAASWAASRPLLTAYLPRSYLPWSSHNRGVGLGETVLTLAPSPLLEHLLGQGLGREWAQEWGGRNPGYPDLSEPCCLICLCQTSSVQVTFSPGTLWSFLEPVPFKRRPSQAVRQSSTVLLRETVSPVRVSCPSPKSRMRLGLWFSVPKWPMKEKFLW